MKVQTGSQGKAILFFKPRSHMGWLVCATPRPL